MALRRILRVSTKAGLGGGIAYYYYDLGLWKDSDSTIQNYEILKKDVNAFLDSSPALVEYVKSASNSVQKSVSSVTEPVSKFRKEWLRVENLSISTPDGIVKPMWNKGVDATIGFVANSPNCAKNLVLSGWNKLQELATNVDSGNSSPSQASSS